MNEAGDLSFGFDRSHEGLQVLLPLGKRIKISIRSLLWHTQVMPWGSMLNYVLNSWPVPSTIDTWLCADLNK